jgi:hypothetical protein
MIVGDREVTNKAMTDYLKEETVFVEKESWWIYALILAAAAIVAIFFHFSQHGFHSGSVNNQQTITVPK